MLVAWFLADLGSSSSTLSSSVEDPKFPSPSSRCPSCAVPPPPVIPPQQLLPQQLPRQQLPLPQLPPPARPDPQSLVGQPTVAPHPLRLPPGIWCAPPGGGPPMYQTFVEAADGRRVELPLYGMPPPPPSLHQQPPPAQSGAPPGPQVQAAGAAAVKAAGAESPPASPTRRCASRRHSGIRMAPRLTVGGLSYRRADVPRLLEVEGHVLVCLGHVMSYVGVVALMIDTAAAALEDVPVEASVMNHAQMRVCRDGAWVLQHEMERAEMEPGREPALGAAAADAMGVVETRVRSRSAVYVLRGLASALRLVHGTAERLLHRALVQ
ncbi:unnamed protein product [Closterium sp. Yama58-4]|nr:unnamed protein product [Closterium sp. Yama58-4]